MTVRLPDDPELAEEAAGLRSAYVHVPFCRRRCPYCDFAVVVDGDPGVDAGTEAYVDAVVAEIGMEAPGFGPLDAVAFGGGTPTFLRVDDLARILSALDRGFGLRPDAEVSIEANPEDWSDELGAGLVAAGFDRITFGVQSFREETLAFLGRLHDPGQAAGAVAGARWAGFRSVGVDLVYGTPGESIEAWQASVERALDLGVDHLSAYALTVERGTALSRAVAAGALPAPDPDLQADAFAVVDRACLAAGLRRYEVSNWARPGHHSRYNLSTWGGGEYVAFGVGAHDHRGGVRSRNVRRLDRYLAEIAAGRRPRAGSERIEGRLRELETTIVGLRRAAGVALEGLAATLVDHPEGRRLVEAGILAVRRGRVVVVDPMRTDAAARAVLSLSEADC